MVVSEGDVEEPQTLTSEASEKPDKDEKKSNLFTVESEYN